MAETPPKKDEKVGAEPPQQDSAPSVPPEAIEAFKKLAEEPGGAAKALLSVFAASSRTTTTVGPDPETAKIMAQVEMHEEDSRLEGYRATLKSRDEKNKRDHEYRLRRLNRETVMMVMALLLAIAGAGVGLYLVLTGNTTLGSNLLIASVGIVFYIIGGKSPFLRGNHE